MGNPIAFACSRNSPGKRDATGAFMPEAQAWCKENHGILHPLDPDIGMNTMRNYVLKVIELAVPAPIYAFFCHGWATGMQLGFKGSADAALLGKALAKANPDCAVIFYCCSTGQGFARQVAAAGPDIEVWSHTSRGHTTLNPMLAWSMGDTTIDLWENLTRQQKARLRRLMAGPERLRLAQHGPSDLLALLRAPEEPSDPPAEA